MKTRLLFFITALLFSTPIFSQEGYSKFWDYLLKNQREEAFQEFNNIQDKSTLEYLIINELLRVERGKLEINKPFFDTFLSKEDYEYYMYALWREKFVFNDYIENGFNPDNITNIDKAYQKETSNIDIKDALRYLKAIVSRYQADWDTYFELNQEIGSVRDWQYCGVFENLNESGLDRFYEPETAAVNTALFDAGSNGLVNWYNAKNEREAYQFFTNHAEYGSGVHYAQTFFTAETTERVVLRIGNGSAFKIWLNDIPVYENDQDVTTELNAYQVELTVPKGSNRLLIKNAEKSAVSYFMLKFIKDNQPVQYQFSNTYKPYTKSSKEEINPVVVENSFEIYFREKLKKDPDNILDTYCLVETFLRNEKHKEAKELVLSLYSKYPNSSFLRKLLIEIYYLENDYTSANEVMENMELDDKDYYFPLIMKLMDSDEVSRMSYGEMEEFLNKVKTTVDFKLMDISADVYLNARKGDKKAIKKNIDDLLEEAKGDVNLTMRYAPIYNSLFQDDEKTMKILEDVNNHYFNMKARRSLSYYYDKKGNRKESLKVLLKDYDALKNENNYLSTLTDKYQDYEKYDEALKNINKGLENFPYSFEFLELKGNTLLQLGKTDEAIAAYEASLSHNSADASLRKKIKDLKNESNLLDELIPEDVYGFISEHKNKIEVNNYGFNILLDDGNIELYPEGGGIYRFVAVYEITSDYGVEQFKEHNLGLSGNYSIIKSEIVKENGSIIPAERSGSNLVFNGLSVGDIIYIDYQNSFSSVGRFYKDYVDYFQFDSFHPTVDGSIQIYVPDSVKLHYKLLNGSVEFKEGKKDGYTLYEWHMYNDPGLPHAENYMPEVVDIAKYLHVSTIDDWNEIAVWYSDLVRSRMEVNNTVEDAFDEIFPDGFENMSELERAEKIYNYITGNFTYSYVSFKQSGFIPQKPSKTINSNLGDCKDFSTLFATLGHMADLDTNLVLVLTADNGREAMELPSQDFNHCIVKLNADGETHFIELTDKYLPFGSLPTSLYNATALEIPYDSNKMSKTYDLMKLDDLKRDVSNKDIHITMNVSEESSKMEVETVISGHATSGYQSIFVEPNYDVVKKSIYSNFDNMITSDFSMDTITNIETTEVEKLVKYTAKLNLNEKLNKIGSITIFQLPMLSNSYTSDLISEETRKYPIEYSQYETVDAYHVTYDIYLDEDKSFSEVPEDTKLNFKKHSYQLLHERVKDNHLRIKITAKPSKEEIVVEEYPEFRNYVKSILEAEKEFIGYK